MHSSGPVFTRPRVYPPAPQSLQPIYFKHGRPTCLFRRKLPGPCLLVFLRITGSCRGFFVLFLVDNYRESGNIFPHFGRDQFAPFLNLPGEHALNRVLGNNLLATWHEADRGLLLQRKIIFFLRP